MEYMEEKRRKAGWKGSEARWKWALPICEKFGLEEATEGPKPWKNLSKAGFGENSVAMACKVNHREEMGHMGRGHSSWQMKEVTGTKPEQWRQEHGEQIPRTWLLPGCEMALAVSHQIIQIRIKFQEHSLGTFLATQPGTWAPWGSGFQSGWYKRLYWAVHGNICRAFPSCVRLVTEAKTANSIQTKNPGYLKHERQPGTANCSLLCHIALSITGPESKPSLGIQLTELSIPIPIALGGEEQELRDGWGDWEWVMAPKHDLWAFFQALPVVWNPVPSPTFT